MIDDKIDSGNILTAVSLSIVTLKEMMSLLNCCDDSDGCVGGCISEAIAKIGEALESTDPGHNDSKKIIIMQVL